MARHSTGRVRPSTPPLATLVSPSPTIDDPFETDLTTAALEKTDAFFREFKLFVLQNRVLETGVGVIVGKAFQEFVRSFVNDVMIPPLTLVTGHRLINIFIVLRRGKTRRRPKTIEEAVADGAVTVNLGRFIHQTLNFFTVGMAVYWFLRGLRWYFRLRVQLPDTKKCPFCLQDVALLASRCCFCTSMLSDSDP
ncbi:hypothetical protein SpCBS45565_g05676 [Spizellomyces sp. 'palustris']|nr:hypothetical protein SpCBS45565_g05676 [Spizellomyces sp. 'palustris']